MVSIIIPLYNVEQYVTDALHSAFNQTFNDIEYILVDDCSTDKTMAVVNDIVKKSIRKDSVKIIHHQCNSGLSVTRNTGVKNASGEYIFFMDSDDEISNECIELHYRALSTTCADFTVANTKLKGAKSVHVKSITSEVSEKSPIESYLSRNWLCSAWNKLYRKSFLLNNAFCFQKGLLFEDILWSYYIASKANKIAVVEKETYVYKIRSNSITTNMVTSHKIESKLFIIKKLIEDWDSKAKDVNLDRTFGKFIGFEKFNTALLLLNYNGTYIERKYFYSQLRQVYKGEKASIYSCILQFPFCLFSLLFNPIYRIYKNVRVCQNT